MYFDMLHIYIISNDQELEQMLSRTEPPEDCGFEFTTVSSAYDLGTLPPDSAVIVDGIDSAADTLFSYDKKLVLLSDAPSLEYADDALLFRADALWVMPDVIPDRRLLSAYFSALASQMKTESDLRKQTICFETMADSIPDLMWFKDTEGAHMMVNDSFCRAVEKTKEQIYKRGHYYIWDIPEEEYEKGEYVCLESEEVVIEAKKTCLFDEKIKTKSGLRMFRTYKSPLIDRDGTVFGTCGVAHDVTESKNVKGEMAGILESLPYAVFIKDSNGTVISVNAYFNKYFGGYEPVLGKNFNEWKKRCLGYSVTTSGGREETRVNVGGEERVLIYGEEPLTDVFSEQIGTICMYRDVTDERHLERQTRELNNTDFLTGLDNMRCLTAHIGELRQADRLTFIAFDIDRLTDVNDKYGFFLGDEALVIAAQTLRSCFWGETVLRSGGDKFIVVCTTEFTDTELRQRIEKALENARRSFAAHERLSGLSCSAGAATALKTDGYDIDRLMKDSASALSEAKSYGGGCCVIYGEEL
ncbi:PAS domain S-box-containing protein/diguanylate cyclase (GGDEF) domain-containing protein [Ruminococcus sp. YE71]|nr:sensor domain-containing diguanylate cyclase [Ruminococcus sp. YE78]SDA16279.1 PAS domain S-box-containing protein/diguanylate cyclase (GGDEF) domain-containing protein [Ruminococcus sp. YE78]SFW24427.1 PAS domain S-box-containing protein/diguanylate cyclase (GGDEF) domain-containing protein [Ruminococcus sp. YE71]